MSQVTTRRVRLEGLLYDYTDAKTDVVIQRTLLDIAKAKRGKSDECMNSKACNREREKFPHPVIATSTWKSRVYVIDEIYQRAHVRGTAGHAIRYILSAHDGKDISDHDLVGVGRPATLVLHAPSGGRRAGSRGHNSNPNRGNPKPRSGAIGKGEKARLLAAVGSMAGS